MCADKAAMQWWTPGCHTAGAVLIRGSIYMLRGDNGAEQYRSLRD